MFIDMHVHTRKVPGFPRRGKQTYATPEQLIARYDKLGIERGVIMAGASPECSHVPQSLEEVLEIAREYSPRFIPFCNVDPRALTNSPEAPLGDFLAYYKERGCKGVGEVTANLRFDDPLVENLLRHCESAELPLTFHMATTIGGTYGLYDEPGLPLLEGALRKFPKLIFLGHSQVFWAEIGPLENADVRSGYPDGPVETEGRVVELLRRYPNLHGDLSAFSGYNAISRDEGFGCRFLEEFQDRLYFGTDICAPDTPTRLVDYLIRLRDEKRISADCFEKIARTNAMQLLGLEQPLKK